MVLCRLRPATRGAVIAHNAGTRANIAITLSGTVLLMAFATGPRPTSLVTVSMPTDIHRDAEHFGGLARAVTLTQLVGVLTVQVRYVSIEQSTARGEIATEQDRTWLRGQSNHLAWEKSCLSS